MKHKYELEKYKGMCSRYECPACHHKGVFARYVDSHTGEYLSSDVGRCNREDKCGYHYTPKQYYKDHSDGKSATGNYSGFPNSYRTLKRYKPDTPKRIDAIPKESVIKSLGYNSNFVRFLCSIFDCYTLESPTVTRLMSEYYFGCTDTGAVIYWQIDCNNKVRAGKIMQYNPETGKRIKNASGAVGWVHSKLKRDGTLSDGWELSQCLFGEHLLKQRPDDMVCLVESEKSAVIGSGTMPGYVWLATGGKQNLKADKCECLKDRDVMLFPDLGAFDEWQTKGKEIARKVGFSLTVSDLLERIASPDDRANGLDIADYLIRQTKTENQRANNEKALIYPLNGEERILQKLGARNPAVLQLIASLGLVSSATGERLIN